MCDKHALKRFYRPRLKKRFNSIFSEFFIGGRACVDEDVPAVMQIDAVALTYIKGDQLCFLRGPGKQYKKKNNAK